jgi:glucose-1-phosphate thymidylyltransferase
MKGIILAGGKATRLYPITKGVCKQLLPVYNKPMIYYPLSTLMLAGIKDVLIICTETDLDNYRNLFGDGSFIGMKIGYKIQPNPDGIAQAFILGEKFIGKTRVCLVLGDNIFYGDGLTAHLREAATAKGKATIFATQVSEPARYGVVTFDAKGRALRIVEKPRKPKSDWAVTGIYFYDADVVAVAKKLKPSARGELEITDVNRHYLKKGNLQVKRLGRGYGWHDNGTYDSLMDASVFIKSIEDRQGNLVGCIEEIAFRQGLIGAPALRRLASTYKTSYGRYLTEVAGHG